MSYQNEEDRLNAGLPPTTFGQMCLKYGFWIGVGSLLLYLFDFNVFQYLGF